MNHPHGCWGRNSCNSCNPFQQCYMCHELGLVLNHSSYHIMMIIFLNQWLPCNNGTIAHGMHHSFVYEFSFLHCYKGLWWSLTCAQQAGDKQGRFWAFEPLHPDSWYSREERKDAILVTLPWPLVREDQGNRNTRLTLLVDYIGYYSLDLGNKFKFD